MRMTVFQSSGVYPEPVRAVRAWQLLHWASTSAFPLASGMSCWAQAGSTEQRRAAAMKRCKWISIVSPRRGGIILAQRPARGKLEGGTTGRGSTVFSRSIVCAALAVTASIAAAQGFPERPIRIIVPLTPGGSPDTIARAVAQGLQNIWSQPVVVENRPGGSQNIGADLVAKSAPDGYTWLLAPDNVFSVNPHLGKPPFDPLTDFAPVPEVARTQFLLVVPPSVPAASVQELVAYARSRPGELNFGSSGNGSPQHLGAALFQRLTGTTMNHVPYKGAAPAVADLLPGRNHGGIWPAE